jgi:SAM-dependent methyltransferase
MVSSEGFLMTIDIGSSIEVPGNASRFFKDSTEAISAPTGVIQLAIQDGLLFNRSFDQELIVYDEQYCTTVSALNVNYTLPILAYLDKVLHLFDSPPRIIDIGCGQGELVNNLRDRNFEAFGFDPVSRVSSDFITKSLWTPKDANADLFILRCVLPHISSPWDFLDNLFIENPNAKVLIEYQRIEWTISERVWYQLNHDHVNLFRLENFENRYRVVLTGDFSNGEWQWVLIEADASSESQHIDVPKLLPEISNLIMEREIFLEKIVSLDKRVVIWGAAGKGIVLAHAISKVRTDFEVTDADSNRWGYFLEGSGKEVRRPVDIRDCVDQNSCILVANPNH